MKKILLLILVIIVLNITYVNLYVNSSEAAITITVDGNPVEFNTEVGYPFIDSSNRTQVPLRAVLERFGALVSWSKNKAFVRKNFIEVEIPIDKPYILKNGVEIANDTKAILKKGRTYIPISSVIDALGGRTIWNGQKKQIEILSQKPRPSTDVVPVNIQEPDHTVSSEVELRGALNTGGNIKILKGFKIKSTLVVQKPVVIDGGGNSIDGAGKTQIFKVENIDFTIQNITLSNGKNTVKNGHFSDQCGAAVMMSGFNGSKSTGSFKAVNVNFINNKCAQSSSLGDIRGGAVYLFSVPDAVFSNCKFIGNDASNGGAIGGLGSSMKIVNCDFIANKASGTGGGQNGSGGAISIDGLDQNGKTAYFEVIGCNFTGNTGDRLGGAVFYVFHKPNDEGFHMKSKGVFRYCTFEYNKLNYANDGLGGAVYAQEGDLNIDSCTFTRNKCRMQGGGLWFLSYTGKLNILNSTFESNTLTSPNLGMGGAISVVAVYTDIRSTTIANNYAWFHGGGIQTTDGGKVKITNCILYNNRSEREWAVYNSNLTLADGGGNLEYLSPWVVKGKMVKDEKSAKFSIVKDPKLLPLLDNGGYTKTMALKNDSPAINVGIQGVTKVDQTGKSRGEKTDIGAFEHE